MDWKAYIKAEMDESYHATELLIKRVDPASLDWKPSEGKNWMTMGQLLQHLGCACGSAVKGFATGDWGPAGDQPPEADMKPEDMLPPAEALPTCESIEQVLAMLAEDRKTGLETLDALTNEEIATRLASAPWDPRELPLGFRIMQMVDHIKQHKGQLFYYLKMQGQDVNTWTLYGMEPPAG